MSNDPSLKQQSGSVLDRIVATTQKTIAEAKQQISQKELERRSAEATPPVGFKQAINADQKVSLIAEVKKASPSKGVIRADFDPIEIAETYAAAGATCISVLTDEPFFQGKLEYLSRIRERVSLPLLRKDFIIDPYQVFEARAAGADAVLLIAECLDDADLCKLRELIESLEMTALVEFYAPENAVRVIDSGATLVGVNNRDLHTFETDLEHTIRMKQQLPESVLVVGESGIRTHADVKRLEDQGIAAMLVGESLMAQADVGTAVKHLLHG